ncbi:transmembrane emp24 domain-containing protein 11-like [Protopterus annectens]|uniref:transmembrane emp24 domain-containing protein 11-like n=1 Tax=Protopterus annectens TaxID=7888 RepID=UPI001CFAA7C6|nr:transmembrane emp24 domain-containing protein 11-like [Protopterus annectens]
MNTKLIGCVFTSCFAVACAMYIQMAEKEQRCIIEDIPSDILVTGHYKMQNWDMFSHDFLPSAPGLGMFVTIKDPSFQVLMSKLYGPESKFSFTSHSSGEHHICFQSNSTNIIAIGGSKLRLHMDIQVGEHSLDDSLAEANDKVNEVKLRVQHLTEQIQHIGKEQNYQREREERFRQMSEDTNANVLWWAIMQTIILLSVGFWQMKHLKDFFIAKKLV